MFIIKILSILLLICVKCRADELLHVSFDEVGALNYTYYGLGFEGPIRLYLYTISGDADLYVSQYLVKPTFEIESHCLESTTCGLDVIDVPRSFKRPVGIGVYGHPSHAKSVYRLEAYYRESGIEDEFFFTTPEQVENERGKIKKDNEFYKKPVLLQRLKQSLPSTQRNNPDSRRLQGFVIQTSGF